jgi:serine/threonine protein kinase
MEDEKSSGFPPGYAPSDVFLMGGNGLLLRRRNSASVVKIALFDQETINKELQVYQRLAYSKRCDRIVWCFGSFDNGIKLEFLPGGCLVNILKQMGPNSGLDKRLRWATQLVEGLRFVHSRNVYYGDLSCTNLVLDSKEDLKMVDFGNAELMGDFPIEGYCHNNHACPPPNDKIRQDIFKLGITLYHILTGSLPYEKDNLFDPEQIQGKLTHLPILRDIIHNCWKSKYSCLDEIFHYIKQECGQYPFLPPSILS